MATTMDASEKSALVQEVVNKVLGELKPKLSTIEDELKKITRRYETQQRTLDLLHKDRNIMEDLLTVTRGIEDLIKSQRDRQSEANKNISSELKETKELLDQSPEEFAEAVVGKLDSLQQEIDHSKKGASRKYRLLDKIFGRNKK